MIAIWIKEMRSYLYSPLFYGLAAAFYALGGYFFAVSLMSSQSASLLWYFSDISIILMFITPLLTMRLFAEERARNTDELLFTLPLQSWRIVLGKYLASLTLYGLLLASSLVYLVIISVLGEPVWGEVISSYFGIVLLGALFLAVGSFISSLTASPLLAAVGGFATMLVLWIAGWASEALGGGAGEFMRALSVSMRLQDFLKGVVDTGNLVFFSSLTVAALLLTTFVLERRGVR